jgi:S-adenosylmethionine hydrolase
VSGRRIVTLLTDFGTLDPYVGAMKAVILGVDPSIITVDVTHQVPPQAVRSAAYVLLSSFGFFPEKTVHVAVVDPGVGSARRAMVLRTRGHMFVAPDNGLLTELLYLEEEWDAVEIANADLFRQPVSSTFHGRDIFAPVGAHLACGYPLEEVGPPLPYPVTVERLLPSASAGALCGEVIWVDRFGNLVTTVREQDLGAFAPREQWATLRIRLSHACVRGLVQAYHEGSGLVALVGSTGRLELSLVQGSAKQHLGAEIGDRVSVSLDTTTPTGPA